MKVEKAIVEKLVITDVPNLDTVEAVVEHFPGYQGKLTVSCFGRSWTAFWGNMGCSVTDFISSVSSDYIINCLSRGISTTSPDLIKDHEFIISTLETGILNGDVDEDSASPALDHLRTCGGRYDRNDLPPDIEGLLMEPWHLDWPTKPNEHYLYLERIVNVVIDAVKMTKVLHG